MKEKVQVKVDPAIKDLGMFVSDVYVSEEEGVTNLNVELDSSEIIDVERITEASRIIQ